MNFQHNRELLEERPLNNIDYVCFAYMAKHERLKQNKTQAEVVHALMSVSQYSKFENGKNIPTYEITLSIAKRLNLTIPLKNPEGYVSKDLIDLVLMSLVLNQTDELVVFQHEHKGNISMLHQTLIDFVEVLTSYQESDWLEVETFLKHFTPDDKVEHAILELLMLLQYLNHHRFRDAMVFITLHSMTEQPHPHYQVLYHEAMYRLMSAHQKIFLTAHHHEKAMKAAFEAKLIHRYERLKLERIEALAKESKPLAQKELSQLTLDNVHPTNQNLLQLIKHKLLEEPIQVNEQPLSYETKDPFYYDLKFREALEAKKANLSVFKEVPSVALITKAKHDLHFKESIEEKQHLLKTQAIPSAIKQHDWLSSIHFLKAQMAIYIDQKRYKDAILCWQRWLQYFNL